MRLTLLLEDFSSDCLRPSRSSSIRLRFLIGASGERARVIALVFSGDAVLGRSIADEELFTSAKVRLRGMDVCGRAAEAGLAEVISEAVTEVCVESLGLGSGGSVSADRGRGAAVPQPLRRLSGLGKGSSRRGGISCSSVSGKTRDELGAGRAASGRSLDSTAEAAE